jgi:endonuclease/exonuclease/phosphatase family metal-dependent hydrolase
MVQSIFYTIFMRYLIIGILLIQLFSCNKNTLENNTPPEEHMVKPYGSNTTLEIATWNVEQFPKKNHQTTIYLAKLIRDLDIDLIAFQEINNPDHFKTLMDSLPDYAGLLSPSPDDQLKLGLLFKSELMSVAAVQQLFIDDHFCFPRPPLYAYIRVKSQREIIFDFSLINVHLKAYHDPLSIERRKSAIIKLKNMIDKRLFASSDRDVLVLGDWNDELSDPAPDNIFLPFLEDSLHYTFLTPVSDPQLSYPELESRIDHILISNHLKYEYQGGKTEVLFLDNEFDAYFDYISDHRPVVVCFNLF